MVINDEFYMSLAITEAWKYQLLTYPNPAVGALVLKNGEITSLEAHQKAGNAHAEVLALKSAYLNKNPKSDLQAINNPFEIHEYLKKNHNGFFEDCEVYVTLEPCNHTGKTPACSDLLVALKPKRVIISVVDPNKKASGGIEKLKACGIDVTTDICKKQGDDLLFPFLQYMSGKFVFFKLAIRANGSIDGGYITSKESLTYVHKLRNVIDTLVIGGNTVRIDRPTLDCRFIENGKSPDVLIYSNQKEFDREIPLFNVANRDIKISNSLEFKKGCVMIEGGYTLLEHLYHKIDMLVLFISPTFKNSNDILLSELKFDILYAKQIGDDELIFMKKRL
ncbi:MAG: bifunctional diaminohydroxyphosphoribosylaminopyrimidine deaminase/5-amino-6-(5-phosphoribosylamino)uracil reductase RibD [Arcobacteraceae bacterium]